MTTIVIGSSNLKRFHPLLDEKLRKSISMQKCTTMDTFRVRMSELDEDDRGIIISVIENFVCEMVGETKEEKEIEARVMKALEEFMEVLKETATKLKNSKFVVVEPMKRPGVKWYNDKIMEFTEAYVNKVKSLGLLNVKLISWADLPVQTFDSNGVHLVPAAGERFFVAVMAYAEHFFGIESIDLSVEAMDETPGGPVAEPTQSTSNEANNGGQTVEERIENIIQDTKKRRHFDSMVTARIREEMDQLINVKKEHKIIVTGLESGTVMPLDRVEKQKWIDDLVGAALDYLVKDSSKGIAFIMPGRKIEKGVPTMFEIRMKDRDLAVKVRKAFSACMRDKAQMQADHYGRLFVANSVTLATRVRSDILKVIAKKCSNDREDFFVIGFTSRPVLTVKRKDGSGQFALTYADAVAKFGAGLSRGELQVAYGRAGESFAGQLQQNFIVLHDKGEGKGLQGAGPSGAAASHAMGGGKKRGNEEMSQEPAKRQVRGGARGARGRGK